MNIYAKIAKIQDEIQNVTKDSQNPHFRNTYATYEKVIETVYPVLRKYKMVSYHSIMPSDREGHVNVLTELRDLESEKSNIIISNFEMPLVKKDPQAAGSAITYAKRYSLLAMLGLGTEDDDGNAQGEQKPPTPKDPIMEATKKVTPQNDVMERSNTNKKKCEKCGADWVKNPHTGKWFCAEKCWLKGKNE